MSVVPDGIGGGCCAAVVWGGLAAGDVTGSLVFDAMGAVLDVVGVRHSHACFFPRCQ